jgi:hypothetical protein
VAAFLVSFLAGGPAFAGWEGLAGSYSGPWKSSDTDGTSYTGKATVKISAGKGNTLKLSVKTSFLANAITATGKAGADGNLAITVTNLILGTVTGQVKAAANGSNGKINGTGVLYNGTATISAKLHASDKSLAVKATLLRAFPGMSRTLTFSFSGKKK